MAAREETTRPSLIIARTHIAYGSPNKQDTSDAHGAPLGPGRGDGHQEKLRLAGGTGLLRS
ncbi:MAG: hypothetical protein U5R49_05875 [Deltaproteobacteria bacterium]|nr:hypothetical protein [Deltaproteobacteria bacterium]